MPAIDFKHTWVFTVTLRDVRQSRPYIWHEGGTRSGKTHNIVAACLIYAAETGTTLDVIRQSNPALKGSIYIEDLLPVAQALGLYSEDAHNKTDQYFMVRDGRVRYYGVDDEQKVRGWKRDVLLMNEANEISNEKRRQLWMRTAQTVIVEHNPTIDDHHWIAKLLTPKIEAGECTYYHSTYKDNTFLTLAQIRRIESMKNDDPYGWQIYGLGLRGSHPAAVFERVKIGAFDPGGDTVYGVDFGFKNPFVVCEWGWRDSDPPLVKYPLLYCRPLLHETHLTTGEAIERLGEMGADKDREMWCDSAEPDRIKELGIAGYNAMPVEKRQGHRKASYDWMKRHTIIVDAEAEAAERAASELRRTRHKKRPGSDTFTDDVVDGDDHVADTGRYSAFEAFATVETPSMGYYSLAD